MRRTIEIRLGPCPSEALLRAALALTGAISLLLAPTHWAWKVAALAGLGLAWRWSAEPRRYASDPRLRIYPDGTTGLVERGGERPVLLTGRAWLSRVVSAIEVRDTARGDARWHRACAAGNADDDYRRLLGVLRLQALESGGECVDR